ncbi:S-adenosylmethionine sensor upstream of mTORC1 [Culicoides brevitarsis]|uniref:S-adenosylmethionine sensor upstream of mTORC1 n=1 Tax=Culicoides brevitarsis TaxID=469753 RepID=UPI00307C7392
MASKEHLELSGFIKDVHKNLRNAAKLIGSDLAWKQHLEEEKQLRDYAEAMKNLSENHWKVNRDKELNRIDWTVKQCRQYFDEKSIEKYRKKEEEILEKAYLENLDNPFKPVPCYRRPTEENSPIRLLDVGSCFNPFTKYENFDVIAIDIAPSKSSGVFKMDFTNVEIVDEPMNFCHNRLSHLPHTFFDVVVFSLLLEYLPSSKQRIKCVQNAYEVLDNEGLLVIITPDSKHVGANAKLMKNWRYTISLMGFNRIMFEKMEHVTCMVFRKCIDKSVSRRWAKLHKEDFMTEEINIPQDFTEYEVDDDRPEDERTEEDDARGKELLFEQLPNVI